MVKGTKFYAVLSKNLKDQKYNFFFIMIEQTQNRAQKIFTAGNQVLSEKSSEFTSPNYIQVPVLETEEEGTLAQTGTIARYLAVR